MIKDEYSPLYCCSSSFHWNNMFQICMSMLIEEETKEKTRKKQLGTSFDWDLLFLREEFLKKIP